MHVCPCHLAFLLNNPIRKWLFKPQKVVKKYINPGDTVIDMGCGPGFFTLEMAKQVGDGGKVIAIDVQEPMLKMVEKTALKKRLNNRITYHKCGFDTVGISEKADFIMAFYMVHETPDPEHLLIELKDLLKPGGKLFIAEPTIHVSRQIFQETLDIVEKLGLKMLSTDKMKGSRTLLLENV